MPMFSKLDPHLVERHRQEIISYSVSSVGFGLSILFGINGIMAPFKETNDDSHESSQFSIMVSAGVMVVLQTTFLFAKTLWSLENMESKIAFASLSFGTVIVVILSYIIKFDEEYQIYLSVLQTLLPTFVIVGSTSLLMLEDSEKCLNQVDKLHIDNKKLADRITLLNGEKSNLELELLESKTENEKPVVKLKKMQKSMEDEIKVLTKQSKLKEMEKKKAQIDLVVKREREELQKDNDVFKKELDVIKKKLEVSEKELEALISAHSLRAEKLRKMEVDASRMKVKTRTYKELLESDWERNAKTITMLAYENEERVEKASKMEKNCVDLRKNFNDMRKNCIVSQGDGEEAFRAAEQALGELIRSVRLLQQPLSFYI